MTSVIKFVPVWKDAIIPCYQTRGSACFDFHVITHLGEPVKLPPGEKNLFTTGLVCEIPEGYFLDIRPRSGLAWRYPNYITNSPGTIDSDYRGEIKIGVVNNSQNYMIICQGDRVAQAMLLPCPQFKIVTEEHIGNLSTTERGNGGFGSTGGSVA